MGACIPAVIGLAGAATSLFKGGKGKKQEYAPQAPEYQQQFGKEFFEMLQQLGGQAGTSYPGQVSAPAMNPFTQSAMSLWGMSPYGQMGGQQMPGMGMSGGQPMQPQMPQQMPQMPMLPQGASMGGGGGPQRQVSRQRPGPRQRPRA